MKWSKAGIKRQKLQDIWVFWVLFIRRRIHFNWWLTMSILTQPHYNNRHVFEKAHSIHFFAWEICTKGLSTRRKTNRKDNSFTSWVSPPPTTHSQYHYHKILSIRIEASIEHCEIHISFPSSNPHLFICKNLQMYFYQHSFVSRVITMYNAHLYSGFPAFPRKTVNLRLESRICPKKQCRKDTKQHKCLNSKADFIFTIDIQFWVTKSFLKLFEPWTKCCHGSYTVGKSGNISHI